jgi:hypothetical protein
MIGMNVHEEHTKDLIFLRATGKHPCYRAQDEDITHQFLGL